MQNLIHHHEGPVEHPEVMPVELIPTPDEYGRKLLRAGSNTVKLLMDAHHEARTDTLTEAPNRLAFDEQFDAFMEQAEKDKNLSIAMVYFDIDGFKGINDTLGHDIGDEVLKSFVALLNHKLGVRTNNGEILARIGGDEFAALIHTNNLENGNRNMNLSPDEIVSGLEDRLEGGVGNLAEIIGLPDYLPEVGISLGYVEYRSEGHENESPAEFKKRADVAMYERKKKRKEAFEAQEDAVEEVVLFNKSNDTISDQLVSEKLEYFGREWDVLDTNNLQGKIESLVTGDTWRIDAENLTEVLTELETQAPKTYKRLSILLNEKHDFENDIRNLISGKGDAQNLDRLQAKYKRWRDKRTSELKVLTTHAFNVLSSTLQKQGRDPAELIK